METLNELMKIIDENLDDCFWTAKNPKRCVLNKYYGLWNIPGYVVEIFDRSFDMELLFIADIPDSTMFHHGSHIFDTRCFKDRCLWIAYKDITIIEIEGFYI